MRNAGLRAIWLGVEDMAAALIKKGQSVRRTMDAFRLLHSAGILPMPMMMHHDDQPVVSLRDARGLLNQVRLLLKAGAITLQVLMISPAPGSRSYEDTFTSGRVLYSAGRIKVQTHMLDGNFVIASRHAKPWRKQLNILLAYLYFYNPLQLLRAFARIRSTLYPAGPGAQLLGMAGLAYTIRRTLGWGLSLLAGRVRRTRIWPRSRVPIRQVEAAGREEHLQLVGK